jgi:hypothetical protein
MHRPAAGRSAAAVAAALREGCADRAITLSVFSGGEAGSSIYKSLIHYKFTRR